MKARHLKLTSVDDNSEFIIKATNKQFDKAYEMLDNSYNPSDHTYGVKSRTTGREYRLSLKGIME